MDNIGDFDIESGKVIVSDPCYKVGTWCTATLNGVRRGMWNAYVIERDGRSAELIATHDFYPFRDAERIDELAINPVDGKPFDIGVDSGQCGFFDAEHFQLDSDIVNDPEFDANLSHGDGKGDRWYNACCDITQSGGADVLPFGVVSESGYGDGSYDLYIKRMGSEIVAIRVVFISEENDDDDWDEEPEETEKEEQTDEDE